MYIYMISYYIYLIVHSLTRTYVWFLFNPLAPRHHQDHHNACGSGVGRSSIVYLLVLNVGNGWDWGLLG
jgi:hypothetical protein